MGDLWDRHKSGRLDCLCGLKRSSEGRPNFANFTSIFWLKIMGMLIVAIYFLGFKEIYSNGIYILDWDSIDMMEFSEIFHGKWDLLSG